MFLLQSKHPAPSARFIYCVIHRLTLWCILLHPGSRLSNISHKVWSDIKEGNEHLICFRHTSSHDSCHTFSLSTVQNASVFFKPPLCTPLSARFGSCLLFDSCGSLFPSLWNYFYHKATLNSEQFAYVIRKFVKCPNDLLNPVTNDSMKVTEYSKNK